EGGCAECLLGVSRAQTGLGKPERAAEAARAAIPLAPAGPLQVRAYHQLGVALSTRTGRSTEELAEAEGAYRKVLELAGADWNVERFNLAGLLFVVGRPAEAAALSREYLRNAANGVAGQEARMLICYYRMKGGAKDAPDTATPDPAADLTPPQAVFRQPAIYGPNARRAGLQGMVAVQVTVDREGCVAQPSLMKGMGNELDTAAVETARRWVFTPAVLGTRPVSSDYIVSVTFAADADASKDPDKAYRDRVLAAWPVQ
ncbi:MAG TPA: energy transducer TonB, partial [Thermoanaerobaculia bacterium]|nr:energy transducer TonB [Thermoanaerobaculia bacterium]